MMSMKITMSRFAATALAFAVLTVAGVANAQTQPVKCSSQITACGCTIAAPGSFTVENALDYSQGLTLKNGCIDITASNVDLYVYYNDITGPGSDPTCSSSTPKKNAGVGIHVLPSASNVSIYTGFNGICGWNYGVESEANNIDWFYVYSFSNNVGMFLNNATANNCLRCYLASNVGSGVQIVGGSGNNFNDSEAQLNGQYGYWVDGSSENTFNGDHGDDGNVLAGFYLGCDAKGNVNPAIPCHTPTTHNSVLASYAYTFTCCGYYPQKYGIGVEKGSIYNTFNVNNTYGNTKKDIIDGNGNCIYNTYLNDRYTTKSPSCIQ
jgi:hypothetical protein